METVTERLARLGIQLPRLAQPSGTYIPCRISGRTLYVSGQVPRIDGIDAYQGVVGESISSTEAREAARIAAINMLAQVSRALDGDLDRVTGCLQLRGFVNAAPGFVDHPAIIDGASDLIVEVLGDAGRHTRTALGAGSLPRGFAVEIDAVFEIQP